MKENTRSDSTRNITTIIAEVGIGIALYIALSMTASIPLIGSIRLDFGYIVFTAWLALFGWWGIPVGVIGCFIKGWVFDGFIPITWTLGQIFVGVLCAYVFSRTNKIWIRIATILLSVFVGMVFVNQGLSSLMFNIPFSIKFVRGIVSFATDSAMMIVGLFIANRIKNRTT